MIDNGPALEAMSNDEIIAKFDSAITAVIKAGTDPQHEADRQIQIQQAREIWQFYLNNHFNVPGDTIGPYGNDITDYTPFDYTSDQQQNGAQVKLCPPINIIGSLAYKYMSVMGANAPRVKGVADDPSDPESAHAGFVADINIRDSWVKQKIDRKWRYLAFHQFVTGPAFIRTFWNADAREYGSDRQPKIKIVEENGLPIPQVDGYVDYPNGDAEIAIFSIVDCSLSYLCSELKKCGRFRFEQMVSKWTLLRKYGEKLDQWRDAEVPDDEFNASDSTANETRGATHNPTGTGSPRKVNEWRQHEYWCDPDQFEAAPKEAREVFQRQFPNGMYIGKVGNITCEIDNRHVTEEWVVCRVGRADNIMERPVAADILPLNRAIDDLFGMALETMLRAIPLMFADSGLVDRNAMSTNEAIPSETILTSMPVDGDMNKHFYQPTPARLSDQARPLLEYIVNLCMEITGVKPELTGGGAPSPTYHEYKQRKDQAMQALAPQAQQMQDAAASVAENLVKLRAKYGSGTVKVQNKSAYGTKTDVADIAELKEKGWHAEADDNFPMTQADQRDAAWAMMKEFPPEVQQLLGVYDPTNISMICQLLQLIGFESVVMDQKEKTMADVQLILSGQEVDPATYDKYPIADSLLQSWLISNQKEKNSNPQGFAAVEAFQQKMHKLATPPVPPPPPPLKGSVSWTGKLEDFPNLVPEILAGEGLAVPAPPPSAPDAGPPPDMGAPGPMQDAGQTAPPLAPPPNGPIPQPPPPGGQIQ